MSLQSNMYRILSVACVLAVVNGASVPIGRPHIIGGALVSIEQYPYQAALTHLRNPHCGASILGPRYIVTAAHCFNPKAFPISYEIRVGSSNKSQGGTTIELYSFFRHPKYVTGKLDFDVGVAWLAKALKFGTGVQPIALVPINKEPQPGEIVTVSGWGWKTANGDRTELLLAVTVPIVSRKDCRKPGQIKITNTMICAGSHGKTINRGDSGGPLVNAKKELVGIVSFTNTAMIMELPGVYTNIADPIIHNFVTKYLPEKHNITML